MDVSKILGIIGNHDGDAVELAKSLGGALEKRRAKTAVKRAGGQELPPSKYMPDVPRAVHATEGRVVDREKNLEAFQKGNHPEVPHVLYHGTTGDFNVFDRRKATIDSDHGQGIYASNNIEDVNPNYAGEGPDLTGRIQRYIEQNFYDNDEDMSEEQMREEAKRALNVHHRGAVMPIHISMKNPVVLGGKNETFYDFNEPYNEKTDEYGEPEGSLLKIIDGVKRAQNQFDVPADAIDEFTTRLYEHASDKGGIYASDLEKMMKHHFQYAHDTETGDYAQNELWRTALEEAGHDGIIDHNVNSKFGTDRRGFAGARIPGMQGVTPETTHYVVFNPNQIKSATGNQGTFDPSEPDITKAEGGEIAAPPAAEIEHKENNEEVNEREHFGFGGVGEGPVRGSTGSAAGNSYGSSSSGGIGSDSVADQNSGYSPSGGGGGGRDRSDSISFGGNDKSPGLGYGGAEVMSPFIGTPLGIKDRSQQQMLDQLGIQGHPFGNKGIGSDYIAAALGGTNLATRDNIPDQRTQSEIEATRRAINWGEGIGRGISSIRDMISAQPEGPMDPSISARASMPSQPAPAAMDQGQMDPSQIGYGEQMAKSAREAWLAQNALPESPRLGDLATPTPNRPFAVQDRAGSMGSMPMTRPERPISQTPFSGFPQSVQNAMIPKRSDASFGGAGGIDPTGSMTNDFLKNWNLAGDAVTMLNSPTLAGAVMRMVANPQPATPQQQSQVENFYKQEYGGGKSSSFGDAFAQARAAGQSTFSWTNPKTGETGVYTTKLKAKGGAVGDDPESILRHALAVAFRYGS